MTYDKESGLSQITQYSSKSGVDHSGDPLWSGGLSSLSGRISEISQWIESHSDELKSS